MNPQTEAALQAIFTTNLVGIEKEKHLQMITVTCVIAIEQLQGSKMVAGFLQAAINNVGNNADIPNLEAIYRGNNATQ